LANEPSFRLLPISTHFCLNHLSSPFFAMALRVLSDSVSVHSSFGYLADRTTHT
jgi:hypothetical protein